MAGAIPDKYQGNDNSGQGYKEYQGKDDASRGPAVSAKPFPQIDRNKGLNLPRNETKQTRDHCCLQENISIGKVFLSKKSKIETYYEQRNDHRQCPKINFSKMPVFHIGLVRVIERSESLYLLFIR